MRLPLKKLSSTVLLFALAMTPTVYGAGGAHDGGNGEHSGHTTHEQNEHSNRCHLRNDAEHENNGHGGEERVEHCLTPTATPTEEQGEEGGEGRNHGVGGGEGENTPVAINTSVLPLQSPTVVVPLTVVPTLQVPTFVATVVGTTTVTITATTTPTSTVPAGPTLVPPGFTAVPTPVLLSGGGNKLDTLAPPYTRPSTGRTYHATTPPIIPQLPNTGGGGAAYHGAD